VSPGQRAHALPLCFPAFKQSPQGIPALGAGVKKRRQGDEEMYYVPVSVRGLRWARARLGMVVAWSPRRGTPWGCGVGQDGAAVSRRAAGTGAEQRPREQGQSTCERTCPRDPWTPESSLAAETPHLARPGGKWGCGEGARVGWAESEALGLFPPPGSRPGELRDPDEDKGEPGAGGAGPAAAGRLVPAAAAAASAEAVSAEGPQRVRPGSSPPVIPVSGAGLARSASAELLLPGRG